MDDFSLCVGASYALLLALVNHMRRWSRDHTYLELRLRHEVRKGLIKSKTEGGNLATGDAWSYH